MNTRIKKIRSELNLTQEEFANQFGIKRNTIAGYESGVRTPSNQTILSICEKYDINEEWLRYGTGEMKKEMSRRDYAASLVDKCLKTDNEFIRNVFIALGELSEDEWKAAQRFVDKLKTDNAPSESSSSNIPASPEELEKKYTIVEHQNSEDRTAG